MISGLIIVILAAVANALVLLVAAALINGCAAWCINVARKLHLSNRGMDNVLVIMAAMVTIVTCACLQLSMWGLAANAEPDRWIVSVLTFSFGRAGLLIVQYKSAASPGERRWDSWFAATTCCGFCCLMFAAFVNQNVLEFLAVLPVRLFVGAGL